VLGIFRSFAFLGQGSAFLHGSQTVNGGYADARLNDLFALAFHQAAVAALEPLDDPILHHLNDSPRYVVECR
jgi:hypothetical protein